MANNSNISTVVFASPNGDPHFHAGAAIRLAENISFNQLEYAVGVSSAAIFTLLMAFGYQAARLKEVAAELARIQQPEDRRFVIHKTATDAFNETFHRNDITFADFGNRSVMGLRLITPHQIYSAEETPHASVLAATVEASATPGLSPRLITYSPDTSSTFYLFNCLGRAPDGSSIYVSYENGENVIYGNAGNRAKMFIAPDPIQQIQAGMNAVDDYFHPDNLQLLSSSIATRFGMGNGTTPLRKFGMFKTPFAGQHSLRPNLDEVYPSSPTPRRTIKT